MPQLPNSATVELAADCGNLLGEGPIWSERDGRLFWVDIKGGTIWRTAWPEGQPVSWTPPCRVTALASRAAGGFVATSDRGFALLDMTSGKFELVGHPEPQLPGNRFNDGKVDTRGAFWAGTMDDAEEVDTGSLYRLDKDLEWSLIDSGYRVTNGPAFSPAGDFLYHNDSARQVVYRFPLHDDGSIGEREIFLRFGEEQGYPDGMTTDIEGCLWIAFWDGWCLRRFSPDGALVEQIDVPVQRPTSCAFGGPGMRQLFITSARVGLTQEQLRMQPLAGGLFVVQPAVGGSPPRVFEG